VIALAGLIACAERPTTSPTDVEARKMDGGFRPSTQAELEGYIKEALQSWRDRRCSPVW
jgi:hypothetical protein